MTTLTYESIYFDGHHYDLLTSGMAEGAELEFYLRQIGKYGAPALELGCGTGRLTIPIAGAGVRIAGLDMSLPMLTRAQVNAAAHNVEVEWLQGDCRNFDLPERYGLIFFPANALLHLLDTANLEACLACVRRHLRKGGAFVCEIFNPSLTLLTRDPALRYPVGEYLAPDGNAITVTENNVYEAATQVNHIKWYYRMTESSKEAVAELHLRMYYPQEIDALLRHNGFTMTAKYGAYDETPFHSTAPRQLIVCVVTP